MPRNTRKQMKRKPRNSAPRMPKELNPSTPQFPGEVHTTMKLRGAPVLHTTTVTSGVIADGIDIQPVAIAGWTTRFQDTYQEYRVIKAVLRIRPVGSSTGVTRIWQESSVLSTPTANQASERGGLTLPNTMTNPKSVIAAVYKPYGVNMLTWTPVNASLAPSQFSVYTDLANYNAPATATVLWLSEVEYTLEFRGLAST